jgi:hypothetical protein
LLIFVNNFVYQLVAKMMASTLLLNGPVVALPLSKKPVTPTAKTAGLVKLLRLELVSAQGFRV